MFCCLYLFCPVFFSWFYTRINIYHFILVYDNREHSGICESFPSNKTKFPLIFKNIHFLLSFKLYLLKYTKFPHISTLNIMLILSISAIHFVSFLSLLKQKLSFNFSYIFINYIYFELS